MNQISPLAFVHPDAKLGDNNIIGPFCYIDGDVVIGDNNVFQNSVTLNQGLRMGSNNEVFPGASLSTKPQDLKFHGEITTCEIGDNNSIIGNSTKFAGEVIVDDNAIISGAVLVHQFTRIGGYVMVQGGSRTSRDIPPYCIAGKDPIRYCGLNLVGLRRRGFSNETIDTIGQAYRIIFSHGLVKEGIEEVKAKLPMTKEIEYVIKFFEESERGVIR